MAVAFALLLSVPLRTISNIWNGITRDGNKKGHHISVDRVICGLLQQRLVPDGWEVVKDPALTYTWRPNEAKRLKGCLAYGRVESGDNPDNLARLGQALARMA